MKLIYKTDKFEEVDVGVFPGRIFRLAANVKLLQSGKVLSEIIAAVCQEEFTAEDARKLSVLDAKRILAQAWVNSYDMDAFERRVVCNCGKTILFEHPVIVDFEPESLFTKAVTITCNKKEYLIKLRSPTIEREEKLMKLGNDSNDEDIISKATDLMLEDSIVLVNNEKPNFEKLPFVLIMKATNYIKKESESIKEAYTEKTVCSCGVEVSSELNVLSQDFLVPKALF